MNIFEPLPRVEGKERGLRQLLVPYVATNAQQTGKSNKAMGYQIPFNSEAPEQSQLSTEFLLVSDKSSSEAPAYA